MNLDLPVNEDKEPSVPGLLPAGPFGLPSVGLARSPELESPEVSVGFGLEVEGITSSSNSNSLSSSAYES
jgi:hypothetical protein